MKQTYIQHKLISIPATSGVPQTFQTTFKADDCYEFLSGVACLLSSANVPTADDIKIELRSDYQSILSFSPYTNWVKNPKSPAFNLQDVFKPLQVDARGRNFYLNVKVQNNTAFDFVALLKQTVNPVRCVRYDAQSFDIATPSLGQGFNITLPSDYNYVKGVMLSGGQVANADYLGFEIYDSAGQIVDPLPMSILTPSVDTPYDSGFYPLDFASKSKQISVRLTALGTLSTAYVATNYTVTFLLVE